MGSRRQQYQWCLTAVCGVMIGIASLYASYLAYHSLLREQQSFLENNAPLSSDRYWLHTGLGKRLSIPHQTITYEASLRSCSWPRVFLGGVVWSAIHRARQMDVWKLLLGLLVAALVVFMARELLVFVSHLQHAAPDTFDCSCTRHNGQSFSRTAYCTFSAHRQDLYHLLEILLEEAASFWKRLFDRVRFSKELAEMVHHLEVWSDRYIKMLHAKAFIKGYETGKAKGRRMALKVGRTAGFLAGEQEGRLEGYARGWKVGYDKGRTRGFQKGRQVGYNRGYNDGYDEGKEKGMREGMIEAREDVQREELTK